MGILDVILKNTVLREEFYLFEFIKDIGYFGMDIVIQFDSIIPHLKDGVYFREGIIKIRGLLIGLFRSLFLSFGMTMLTSWLMNSSGMVPEIFRSVSHVWDHGNGL